MILMKQRLGYLVLLRVNEEFELCVVFPAVAKSPAYAFKKPGAFDGLAAVIVAEERFFCSLLTNAVNSVFSSSTRKTSSSIVCFAATTSSNASCNSYNCPI